jgi:hypothetical protein
VLLLSLLSWLWCLCGVHGVSLCVAIAQVVVRGVTRSVVTGTIGSYMPKIFPVYCTEL